MNVLIKKITALLLAFVLFLGFLPAQKVLANTQLPVSTLKITDHSVNISKDEYKFELQWDRPIASTLVDNTGNESENTAIHRANGYDMFYRNATLNTPFEPLGEHVEDPNKDNLSNSTLKETLTESLSPGSMYLIEVRANHTHIKTIQNPLGNGTINITVNATTTSPEAKKQVLYMTDLDVQAEGLGDTMTVTWSRPAFDGTDIFSGYKIYFAIGGSAANAITDHVIVAKDDPRLLRRGNEYIYSFQSDLLKQGAFYAVKVEPLYGAAKQELRAAGTPITTVNVGGKNYDINYTRREYRDNDAYVSLDLKVAEISKTEVELYWRPSETTTTKISKLLVLQSDNPNFDRASTVATLYPPYTMSVDSLPLPKPDAVTYYKLVVFYKDTVEDLTYERESIVAIYDPAYEQYNPTKPTILEITDKESPISMDIVWEALVRNPFNELEEGLVNPETGLYLDLDLLYNIWVTDDLALLDSKELEEYKIGNEIDAKQLTLIQKSTGIGTNKVAALTYGVEYYMQKTPLGYEKKPLEDNKIYYVKIVAKRKLGKMQESVPAYGSHFITPKGEIDVRPVMLSKLPLRIKKDANGKEEIGETSINIQWDINWIEAYNATKGTWHTSVGIDENGAFVFGKDITDAMYATNRVLELNAPYFSDAPTFLDSEARVADELKKKGAKPDLVPLLPLRPMSLSDASYEIHVVEYDHMEKMGGYDAYLASINDVDDQWVPITPTGDPKHPEFLVDKAQQPTASALKSNTSYAILVKPYRNLANGTKKAFYPNVIVATTIDPREPLDIKPTVPILEPVQSFDTSLRVRFAYTEALQYEIAYSELLADYPQGGKVLTSEELLANGNLQTIGDQAYMYVNVQDLFPETIHYLWIRSFSDTLAETVYSEWSNPISMRTNELTAPLAPKGLGLASLNHLDIINKEANLQGEKQLFPIDSSYMIIEWLRDLKDNATEQKGAGESAGNTALLLSQNIKDTYMVQFKELLGNRAYYVRAKTRLTITKGEEGALVSTYQYVVQLSLTDNFLDVIEVTVPGNEEAAGQRRIVKESPFTDVLRFFTAPYKGEYDGDKNPDMYPLPETDFELTYNYTTDTLSYRFRSNQTDASGKKDNGVDQRFISLLLQNKTFNYGVDLTAYKNKVVKNRSLEMPYSILKAMEEQKIRFTIKSGDTSFAFAPGFLQTSAVKNLSNFGVGSKVTFTFTQDIDKLPAITKATETHATPPQKITISIATPTQTVQLSQTAVPMEISQKITSRSLLFSKNVGSYVRTPNDTAWVRQQETFNEQLGRLEFKTTQIASYAAIAKNAPNQQDAINEATKNQMYDIQSALNFRDMSQYSPNDFVSAASMNSIILAISQNKKEVYVYRYITDAEIMTLSKAGLLVTGSETVSRDEAISAMVRLYELKTKTSIKTFPSLQETSIRDIQAAETRFQTSLLKAEQIGFLGNNQNANPKAPLNYADMLFMVDMILAEQ